MSLANQRTLIEGEFMTEMALVDSDVLLIGENADQQPTGDKSWIRMSITILEIYYPCIGQSQTRTDAIFNVQIFTPLAIGANKASTLVDEAVAILKGSNLPGIEFLTFDVSTGVIESDWFSIVLRATYRATE